MRKNHETTTLLVAMAAIAATLLAAGTVASIGSNQYAFAHGYKKSYGKEDKYGRDNNYGRRSDGNNILKCIVIGGGDNGGMQRDSAAVPGPDGNGRGGGISDHSCNNYDGGNDNSQTGPDHGPPV